MRPENAFFRLEFNIAKATYKNKGRAENFKTRSHIVTLRVYTDYLIQNVELYCHQYKHRTLQREK